LLLGGRVLARRFLWIVTALVLIVLAGALALRIFSTQLMRAAFVPSAPFEASKAPAGPDYRQANMWVARPDISPSPAFWVPPGVPNDPKPRASVFFIHPTSYLSKDKWNGPIDDADSQWRTSLFVQTQASAFNQIGAIWAPRYRQATVGAFLSERPDAEMAISLAYHDVSSAFDQFLKEAPADRPIILAAHSQGSLHLARLLRERVAGSPTARRIAAAYVIGWPLSTVIDLPRMGLPACRTAADSGCILAWQSFSEPAEPKQLMRIYDASMGPNGTSRAGTPILCVNPLTGNAGDAAPASANLGTLLSNAQFGNVRIEPKKVSARCDERGLLLIGENPPDLPPYVLPGNNYHVFDYALFWANIRADAERRLDAFMDHDSQSRAPLELVEWSTRRAEPGANTLRHAQRERQNLQTARIAK
jgi:hypothetical protein